METKANFALLGAAALVGVVMIMLFAMWLANSEFREGVKEYDIVFDDPVRGLAEGGEVRFNGIKVGEVQELRIDAENTNRVIARVRISADIPVRADSEARLEPIGLTGVTLIQLTSGSPTADLLNPRAFGPPPRIIGHGSQIDVIVERGEDIVVRASEAMAAVRDLLTDENIARVSRIIADLEVVSQQLAAKDGIVTQSGQAAAALAESARAVTALTAQSQTDLHLALVDGLLQRRKTGRSLTMAHDHAVYAEAAARGAPMAAYLTAHVQHGVDGARDLAWDPTPGA